MTDQLLAEKTVIRALVEDWVVWRDGAEWEKLESLWWPEAVMVATWRRSGVLDFIEGCRAAWERGVQVRHTLGGTSVEVVTTRAISQSKMAITQRAQVEGVEVDVTCSGLFYDFLEKRDERWALLLRQPIYESDRCDPVDPAIRLSLDRNRLDRFPEGYRHLGYVQTLMGLDVSLDLPVSRGPAVERLRARGAEWLNQGVSPLD